MISGRSASWAPGAIAAAERFARHLAGALLRRDRDSAALAKDLQQAMLPAHLPVVAGLEFDAFYQPSGIGAVGGDWYDAFLADDHLVAAVIGDVAGHGLGAASEMTQLRNILRGFLVDRPEPADALERLDRFMHRELPGSIATVVCAVVDVRTGVMSISHAGHLPAVRFHGDSATFLPLQGDHLLGMSVRTRTVQHVQLNQHDTVVLYSDGLIENRSEDIDDGLDRLLASSSLVAETAIHDVAAELVHHLADPTHDDDVTVLVIRLT